MDLSLSPEQEDIRKLVHDFALREVKPRAEAIDHHDEFPRDLVDKAAELGLMGMLVPETYGGAGLDHIAFAIFIEEVARFAASTAGILDVHGSVGTEPILRFGSEEQKRRWLPALAGGKTLAAFALTEPEAGSDAAGTRTKAAMDDGKWVLNGAKTFTTNAHYADVCVAMAVTDRGASQHGISAFILEKGTDGFKVGKKENKLGMRASATGEVLFTDCRLPRTQLRAGEQQSPALLSGQPQRSKLQRQRDRPHGVAKDFDKAPDNISEFL